MLFEEIFEPTICVCDQTPRDNRESRDKTPRTGRDQTPHVGLWIVGGAGDLRTPESRRVACLGAVWVRVWSLVALR
jgi:hypothetical protein